MNFFGSYSARFDFAEEARLYSIFPDRGIVEVRWVGLEVQVPCCNFLAWNSGNYHTRNHHCVSTHGRTCSQAAWGPHYPNCSIMVRFEVAAAAAAAAAVAVVAAVAMEAAVADDFVSRTGHSARIAANFGC